MKRKAKQPTSIEEAMMEHCDERRRCPDGREARWISGLEVSRLLIKGKLPYDMLNRMAGLGILVSPNGNVEIKTYDALLSEETCDEAL